MFLSRIQNGLQVIYELDVTHQVDHFLTTDRELALSLQSGPYNRTAREKLFVHEDGEDLNLSLYLDEKLIDHFSRNNPFDGIDGENVQEFCLVLEGISHFLYLVWNASYDRSVTLMEMELQAEVDKFIMLMECLGRQENKPAPGQLVRLLFDTAVYHGDLSSEEERRYRQAVKYAGKYCRLLESRYFQAGDREGLLAELRRFYRLTKQGKLKRILQAH